MAQESSSVFLRPVSGLIKSAGTLDVFIYNVGLVSVGIGIAYTHLMGPANYPGGDIGIASVVATVLMLLIGWALWCWTVCLPRSGGIYVFVTRTFGPGLGFVASYVESFCWLALNAAAGVLVATVGVAPMLTYLAGVSHNARLAEIAKVFDSKGAQFGLGAVLILLSGGLLVSGMRRFFFVQKVMFAIALVGTAVMLWYLGARSQADFIANFNRMVPNIGPNPYASVIDTAKNTGWSSARFDWWQTVRLSVWPFLPLIGGAFSIAIGGEVRQVRRNQAIGILGSILFCGLLFALIGALSYKTIGFDFQGAVTFNADHNPGYSTATKPYLPLLLYYLADSPAAAFTIALSFIAWIYFWVPGMLSYAQRSLLAWSFDRLAPDSAGYVSEKRHTPVTAIVATTVVSLVILYFYVYTDLFPTLTFILAAASAWLIATLAGCVFPYLKPGIFGTSPIAHQRLAGVPLMSVANALGSVALVFMIILLWNDPLAAGHGANSLGTVVSLYATGTLWYLIAKAVRRRQGVDVSRAVKEIPIE